MKEILNKVTNFINENTMLLIGICAFLILVLIIYLIDNSIKTKKMEKAIKEMDETEDKVINSNLDDKKDDIVEINIKSDEEVKNEPKFDSISLVDEENELSNDEVETKVEPEIPTPVVEEPKVQESVVETPKEEVKFTNKKSLSEILAKKKDNNLDLNNNTDKTLEETTEFNNTF